MPRFEKGTIQLSEAQDIPLLRQICHSAYATKQQLFDFMRLHGRERSRDAFQHRLHRLAKHTLVQRIDQVPGFGCALYAIAAAGLDLLITRGEPYAGRGCGVDRPLAAAQHAVQLNAIHLSLLRSGQLYNWMPETEICSRNILTTYGFAKDYDAVVTVGFDEKQIAFALEYERSQKTDTEYQSIAIALNRETNVEFVLYLAATHHLMAKVTTFLRHCRHSVAVCLASDFNEQLFETPIILSNDPGWRLKLRELIDIKRALKDEREPRSAAS